MGNTESTAAPPTRESTGSNRRKSSGTGKSSGRNHGTSTNHASSSSNKRSSGTGGIGGKDATTTNHVNNSSTTTNKAEDVATRAQNIVGDNLREFSQGLQKSIKRLEENDHPAALLIDSVCGPYLDSSSNDRKYNQSASFYSEDVSEDDSRTISEDETTTTTHDYVRSTTTTNNNSNNKHSKKEDETVESASYFSQSDYESQPDNGRSKSRRKPNHTHSSSKRSTTTEDSSYYDDGTTTEDETTAYGAAGNNNINNSTNRDNKGKPASSTSNNETNPNHRGVVTQVEEVPSSLNKPLASAFAKRCYFTKAGIGKSTQHYEGLTLTGNVVLMLAAAMKLKGCPTICDEDLRRVEQTYPNQFSRLPDELLLSSGWRRISKYCHFSNKPIPDGVPFFHSKQRLHPSGGYYFLLAAAVGMVRPIDVEPLNRDTLVLLETDYPAACDAAPRMLIQDPLQWTLVDKFCFFSGGPINTEEDVYYQADFDGNPIYMLAFLSPSLTPTELYKLDLDVVSHTANAVGVNEPGLKTVDEVVVVESVYDLTERDFDDLKLYHLGPCRALPQYILQPPAWTKVLPPHFLAARQTAMLRAQEFEMRMAAQAPPSAPIASTSSRPGQQQPLFAQAEQIPFDQQTGFANYSPYAHPTMGGFGQSSPSETYGHSFEGSPDDDGYGHASSNHHQYDPHPIEAALRASGNYMHLQQAAAESYGPMSLGTGSFQQAQGGLTPHVGPNSAYPIAREPPTQHQQQPLQQRTVRDGSPFTDTSLPMDEAIAAQALRTTRSSTPVGIVHHNQTHLRMDPPEDEPPSLRKSQGDSREHDDSAQDSTSEDHHESYYHDECEEEQEEVYFSSPDKGGSLVAYDDDEDVGFAPSISQDGSPNAFDSPESRGSLDSNDVTRHRDQRPPPGPRSPASEFSSQQSQSPAMRGAQELLRRNRQKRLELARKKKLETAALAVSVPDDEESFGPTSNMASPRTESDVGSAWGSGSEVTSIVSGSSVWTDNTNNPDRSSRRALILQMAKARMKSNNKVSDHRSTAPVLEEEYEEEEKKLESHTDTGTDIDLTEDLD